MGVLVGPKDRDWQSPRNCPVAANSATGGARPQLPHHRARRATLRRTSEIREVSSMTVGQDQRRVDATATRRGSRPKFAMRLASGQSGRSA